MRSSRCYGWMEGERFWVCFSDEHWWLSRQFCFWDKWLGTSSPIFPFATPLSQWAYSLKWTISRFGRNFCRWLREVFSRYLLGTGYTWKEVERTSRLSKSILHSKRCFGAIRKRFAAYYLGNQGDARATFLPVLVIWPFNLNSADFKPKSTRIQSVIRNSKLYDFV